MAARDNINNIAFEQIKADYYWGKYGEFKVIIDISTGYINATHLCGLALNKNGKPKEFRMWRQNNTINELIDAVSASVRILTDELMTIPVNLPIYLRGTYVHPDLIPHIASWASPKFAVMVSKIINKHMIAEAVKEKERLLQEKDGLLVQKQDKIDELLAEMKVQTERMDQQSEKMDQQSAQIQALLDLNHEMKDQNTELLDATNDLTTAHDEAKEQVTRVEEQVTQISKKLEIATIDRVPMNKVSAGNQEHIRIYARPITDVRIDQFKVLRRQTRTLRTGIETLHREGYTILVAQLMPTPNAVDIWNRLKAYLKLKTIGKDPQVVRLAGNAFSTSSTCKNPLTRELISAKLVEISNEKFNV